MRRLPEVDALRGLMLVWMTFTHLPTIASIFSNQPFGFVSAAEGFIFLSALLAGRVYFRVAERDGAPVMQRKLVLRTLRLYGYHAFLMAFAFVVVAQLAVMGDRPGLYNLLTYYFVAGPKRAVIDAALLLYRPPLLDILPMYIFFLILTPIVLSLCTRIGWKPILATSIALWAGAQFGLRVGAYNLIAHFDRGFIPLDQMGAFDLWAWQMLWVVGLWCGVRWAKGDLPATTWARRFLVPACFIIPPLLFLRYALGHGIELGAYEPMFDKWHLGVVRLFDFAAIAAVLVRFHSTLKPLAVRPLVLLGQSSLQVFCAHLFFCFFGLALMGNATKVNGWQQVLLLSVTFSAMLMTAKIFGKSASKGSQGRGGRSFSPTPATNPSEG